MCCRYHINLNRPGAVGRVATVLNKALEREAEGNRSFVRRSFVDKQHKQRSILKPPQQLTHVLSHLSSGDSGGGNTDFPANGRNAHPVKVVQLFIKPHSELGGSPKAKGGWGHGWRGMRRTNLRARQFGHRGATLATETLV